MMSNTVLVIYVENPGSRRALSLAAMFGALPTQTKSLLFLIPLLTTKTFPVSMPTVWFNFRPVGKEAVKNWSNAGTSTLRKK